MSSSSSVSRATASVWPRLSQLLPHAVAESNPAGLQARVASAPLSAPSAAPPCRRPFGSMSVPLLEGQPGAQFSQAEGALKQGAERAGRLARHWARERSAADAFLSDFNRAMAEAFSDLPLAPAQPSSPAQRLLAQHRLVCHGWGWGPRRWGTPAPARSELAEQLRARGWWGGRSWAVQEAEGKYRVKVALPGLPKEKVKIQVSDANVLSIEAQQQVEEKGTTWASRLEGVFERKLRLPEDIQREKINASMENGVLTVTVPKVPKAEPPQPMQLDIPIA